MKYNIVPSNQFKKDLKSCIKRGYDISLLENIVDNLASGIPIPFKHKNHSLSGMYSIVKNVILLQIGY